VLTNALIAAGHSSGRYRLFGVFRGTRRQKAVEGLLESIDLWDKRNEVVSSLAYGETRKLEMGLSLASAPDLLMLDEPSCGLTPTESADIMSNGCRQEITVPMISHDMDLAFGVAERILLHFGEISCEGSCDEIRANQTVKDIYMGSHKASTAGG
jgi:ABC-type branched-subunit amino acid transport system ATPase component